MVSPIGYGFGDGGDGVDCGGRRVKENLTENREPIENIVMEFYKNIKDDENHRFKSWEHCFDFFKSVPTDIDLACLHLGFYLASWGMYRGSSFLLQKDYKIHKTAVCEVLKSEYDVLRGIELQCFNDEKINILFGLIGRLNTIYQNIKKSVETKNNDRDTTDTLITKILLGTLGCIPAYDRFFINGIRQFDGLSYSTLNETNFRKLLNWCDENKDEIQEISEKIKYPPMKIVDMYFWSMGAKFDIDKKEQK
jgi:hypothetical protein